MSSKLPAPELRELIRVVPIAQSQVHNGVTVMMLALELYTDGFVVTSRVRSDDPWPFEDDPYWSAMAKANAKGITASEQIQYAKQAFNAVIERDADLLTHKPESFDVDLPHRRRQC